MTITDGIRPVRAHNTSTRDDHYIVLVRCSQWRKAFRDGEVAYPAAVLAIPVAANWVRDRGSEVNARSPQGIALAMSAGVPPARVLYHCAGATRHTIDDAMNLGVGQFVVDSANAAKMIGACAERRQQVRVDVTCGAADELITAVLAEENLWLTGLYSEEGNPAEAVLRMLGHIADVRSRHDLLLSRVGVALRGGQSGSPASVAAAISDAVDEGCVRFRLPRPALTVFPDRIALTHDL